MDSLLFAVETGVSLFVLFLIFVYARKYIARYAIKVSPKTIKFLDSIKGKGETYEDAIRRVLRGEK